MVINTGAHLIISKNIFLKNLVDRPHKMAVGAAGIKHNKMLPLTNSCEPLSHMTTINHA